MTKYKPDTSIFGMSNTIDICQTGYDYEQYQLNELEHENIKLKKQLEIAKKALKFYSDTKNWDCCIKCHCAYVDCMVADIALKEIDLVNTSAKE